MTTTRFGVQVLSRENLEDAILRCYSSTCYKVVIYVTTRDKVQANFYRIKDCFAGCIEHTENTKRKSLIRLKNGSMISIVRNVENNRMGRYHQVLCDYDVPEEFINNVARHQIIYRSPPVVEGIDLDSGNLEAPYIEYFHIIVEDTKTDKPEIMAENKDLDEYLNSFNIIQ